MLSSRRIVSMQFELRTLPLQLPWIDQAFKRASASGYNTVMLEYGDTLPVGRRSLRGPWCYSTKQVSEIDRMAQTHGLSVIPSTYSFSHSDLLLKKKEQVHLAEGPDRGSLCLSNPKTIELMVYLTQEMKRLHPSAKFVHLGGDEIFNLAVCPACTGHVWNHGRSGLVIDFLNRLAEAIRPLNVRPAIWSDMLIRYPQSLDRLSRDYLIFYWDYWSQGERQPWVTIGGGCPDLFVLDPKTVQKTMGDLTPMMRFPTIRPKHEIPCGLKDFYASLWQLDQQETSARSYPYLKFFVDQGFDTIAAALPYGELSGPLPNVVAKWDHLQGFAREVHRTGAAGGQVCHWVPNWPMMETLWLGMLAFAQAINNGPQAMDDRSVIFDRYTMLTLGQADRTFAQAVMANGQRFELADVLAPNWQTLSPREKLAWHQKQGLADLERQRAKRALVSIESAMPVFESRSKESFHAKAFLLAAREAEWKARCQLSLLEHGRWPSRAPHQFKSLAKEAAKVWSEHYQPSAVRDLMNLRFGPFPGGSSEER